MVWMKSMRFFSSLPRFSEINKIIGELNSKFVNSNVIMHPVRWIDPYHRMDRCIRHDVCHQFHALDHRIPGTGQVDNNGKHDIFISCQPYFLPSLPQQTHIYISYTSQIHQFAQLRIIARKKEARGTHNVSTIFGCIPRVALTDSLRWLWPTIII